MTGSAITEGETYQKPITYEQWLVMKRWFEISQEQQEEEAS